jgi:hypothetical protein
MRVDLCHLSAGTGRVETREAFLTREEVFRYADVLTALGDELTRVTPVPEDADWDEDGDEDRDQEADADYQTDEEALDPFVEYLETNQGIGLSSFREFAEGRMPSPVAAAGNIPPTEEAGDSGREAAEPVDPDRFSPEAQTFVGALLLSGEPIGAENSQLLFEATGWVCHALARRPPGSESHGSSRVSEEDRAFAYATTDRIQDLCSSVTLDGRTIAFQCVHSVSRVSG